MEARERYREADQWAQMHPYVLNWRNPWNDETGFYKEDPAKHTLGFYEDLVQDAAEDLGMEDSPLVPGGSRYSEDDDDDVVSDGGLDWMETIDEYWNSFHGFDQRHPPRYVDPGSPLDHDTVSYFPHNLFQSSIRKSVDSDEAYLDVMDTALMNEYDIRPVLDLG